MATGVRNFPRTFPFSTRISTVSASITPPLGVQFPDQVPVMSLMSAAAPTKGISITAATRKLKTIDFMKNNPPPMTNCALNLFWQAVERQECVGLGSVEFE